MLSTTVRTALLLVPFALLFWLQWLRSIPRQSRSRVHETNDPASLALISARRNALLSGQGSAGSAGGVGTSRPAPREATAPSVIADADAAAPGTGGCPASRKPYHVLLTATAQVYQQWQCRVMYTQWKRIRDADPAGPCTEMTGFTRLVASAGAQPDGLETEIPSVFTPEWDARDLGRFHGYRVINRPRSVVHFLKTAEYKALKEEYIFIAETDHILLQPIPNRASKGSPMAHVFGCAAKIIALSQRRRRIWGLYSEESRPHTFPVAPERLLPTALLSPADCPHIARLPLRLDT
jgi:hypothetical protein